jgi:hypothetical protein
MVPEAGIEPARAKGPRDFKSLASAYSATPALVIVKEYFVYSFSKYIIAPQLLYNNVDLSACVDLSIYIDLSPCHPAAISRSYSFSN